MSSYHVEGQCIYFACDCAYASVHVNQNPRISTAVMNIFTYKSFVLSGFIQNGNFGYQEYMCAAAGLLIYTNIEAERG